jgi:hypothetical protein
MDQRTQARVVADRKLTCRSHGFEHAIFVYNLSSDGCMALFEDDAQLEDDRNAIVLSPRCEAAGRVDWRHGSFMGIAFARKLDPAVVGRIDLARSSRAHDAGCDCIIAHDHRGEAIASR